MKSPQLEECVLCCREIEIYAVGACDHPVCYECSTRMRVLCETNECPICRSDVPIVVFTHEAHAFTSAERKFSSINRTYHIRFEDEKIAVAFERLLENRCKSCEEIKPNFNKLKEHVRREHELHYCDLCTDNLKIFTFERKCYSRKDLARHKRMGDPDETSHRGHPLCEFCDQRYMDKDDLFRHLRREHYFCHFCDADGKHQYYKDYDYLRVHFRKDHYLCEEGDCINEKFTGAFRSEIDLKAHTAIHHSKNKSKQEVKQTRLLEFEFAPPPRHSGSSSPRGGRYAQQRRRNEDDINSRNKYKTNQQIEVESLDTQSVQDFPFLSEDNKGTSSEIRLSTFNRNAPPAYGRNKMSPEDFPALCPTSAPDTSSNQNKKMNYSAPVQLPQRNSAKQNSNSKQQPRIGEVESVDRSASQQKGKWINKKSNLNFEEEFPTLEVRKKTIAPAVVPVPVTVSNTTSNNVINRPTETVAKPPVGDQFVIIKSKSKKKKPIMPYQSDLDKEEDSNSDPPVERRLAQRDEGINDPFKKSLVHPLLSSKPPIAKNNDYWETEKVNFGNDDFPPLAPTEPAKKPPGLSRIEKPKPPPPGFTAHATSRKPTAGHKTLSALVREIVMPSQNGMGKSFSDDMPTYVKPPDFTTRNENLIKRIYEITGGDDTRFNKFKVESGAFRHSTVSAAEYHAKCLEILGDVGFLEIFPELVSLLPDIKKQQELLAVHNTFLSHKIGGAFSKKAPNVASPVVSCDTCNQVLVIPDCKNHTLSHS